jgi:hypothetical protein
LTDLNESANIPGFISVKVQKRIFQKVLTTFKKIFSVWVPRMPRKPEKQN